MKKLLRYARNILVLLGLLVVGVVAYFFYGMHRAVSKLNDVPLSQANYEPAALELAKLCQSDPSLFSKESVSYLDPFDPVWAPPSVAKLHPEVIDISTDHANVTWGGGFYHCGWELTRESGSTWTLSFTAENKPQQVLKTFSVDAKFRVTEDEFIKQVLAEFDRRLASQADDGYYTSESSWYLPAGRCVFLAKHQRTDLLPAEVRKAAANYPHDWRDVVLAYLLDHSPDDPSAGKNLRQWADRTTGPAAWIYLAYAFYQAGDIGSGDAAVAKAVSNTVPDPEWIDKGIPMYELAMASRLYYSGDFRACVSFCDGILSSRHRYFTTRSSVQTVRDLAAAGAATRPTQLPAFDKFTSVDPFGGFDLKLLHVAASGAVRGSPRH